MQSAERRRNIVRQERILLSIDEYLLLQRTSDASAFDFREQMMHYRCSTLSMWYLAFARPTLWACMTRTLMTSSRQAAPLVCNLVFSTNPHASEFTPLSGNTNDQSIWSFDSVRQGPLTRLGHPIGSEASYLSQPCPFGRQR
jgi:hypothetical protein